MSFVFGPFTLTLLLCILWVTSLPGMTPLANQQFAQVDTSQPQALQLRFDTPPSSARPPGWRDVLVLRLAITDPAIQQQRGQIIWKIGSAIGRYPITVVTDGAIHDVVIPLGITPAWSEADAPEPPNLQLVFPHADQLDVRLVQVTLVTRSPFALDALLGWLLLPLLSTSPAWESVALLTAALLSFGVVCTMPGPLRQRVPRRQALAISWVLLCAIPNASAVASQLALLPRLWQHYGNQPEPALITKLPHYNASPRINALLEDAAAHLPDGRVVVIPANPGDTYLKARAHYALFPRVVVFAPNAQPVRLKGATGVIQPERGQPPKPGWQRIASPIAGYEIWRASNAPSTPRPPTVHADALPGFVLGLALVISAGWGIAAGLGWAGWARLACSLPFGMGLVAGWMALLSSVGVGWSAITIGLLLLLVGGMELVWLRRSNTPGAIPQTSAHIVTWVAALLLLGLTLIVTAHAVMVPFSDQDTWTTWGFNSRALFTEGNLPIALTRYAEGDLNHANYPPALPLLQAGGFYSMGGISERLIKTMMPIWYLSLIVLVWAECRRWTTPACAAACALWLATTPLFLDHATLGNADLPFTTLLVAAAIALIRWLELRQNRWLLNATVLLSIATLTKLDGFYLSLLMLALAWLIRTLSHSTHSPHLSIHLPILFSVVVVMALQWSWTSFTQWLGIKSESPSLAMLSVNGLSNFGRGLAETISEMLFSHNNSTWSLLGSGYGLLWVVGCGAAVLGWRTLRRDATLQFLLLGVIGIVVFYILIYALRPYFSIERYLMHAAPLLVLAAARAWRPQP
jgi:hypothetical protein